jgi:hypothetical protein
MDFLSREHMLADVAAVIGAFDIVTSSSARSVADEEESPAPPHLFHQPSGPARFRRRNRP